jgi:hypothetical protein
VTIEGDVGEGGHDLPTASSSLPVDERSAIDEAPVRA